MPAVDHCQLAEFLLFSGGLIVAASRRFGDQGKDPTYLFDRTYIRFFSVSCAGKLRAVLSSLTFLLAEEALHARLV